MNPGKVEKRRKVQKWLARIKGRVLTPIAEHFYMSSSLFISFSCEHLYHNVVVVYYYDYYY